MGHLQHPDISYSTEWDEWRRTFRGGQEYRDYYLKKWSDREEQGDFNIRRDCTPIPTFAKAAILDIRNSIFQRLEDVLRIGGTQSYQQGILGERGGVDRKGTSMSSFMGIDALTELLVMGRVGIYVDAPNVDLQTLAQQAQEENLSPYCYVYRVEDILSFVPDDKGARGTFKAVLLRDHVVTHNTDFAGVELPSGRETRLRLVWKENGKVRVKLWKEEGREPIIMADADPDGGVTLNIDTVPFTMPDIGDSLMKDIASYQHALLNLVSGDVNWSLQSSSPFLTIQQDLRSAGAHLKKPGQGNTPEPGGQHAKETEERIGGKGRYYDMNTDRPDYIAPPTAPLEASMRLQEKLEDDIRKLINLAVSNKAGSRTESAEAKKLSSQGLEAGLSYIGLVLQSAERHITKIWSAYENADPAVVTYPARYILKQDIDRIEEATKMLELMDRITSNTARKSMAKQIVTTLVGARENSETLKKMLAEVEKANYTSSSVADIIALHSEGLVSDETASTAVGFDGEKEVREARSDKAERAALILLSQSTVSAKSDIGGVLNAARGVPDLSANPGEGKEEKVKSREKKEAQDE